jgi:hypothetical protein
VYQADPGQVAHRARYRRGADPQHAGDVRGGEPVGVGNVERDEDAGRHGREPRRDEHRGEPLDELKPRIALLIKGCHHVSKDTAF